MDRRGMLRTLAAGAAAAWGARLAARGNVMAAGVGTIERLDPALDALIAPGAAIEKVAGGFRFTEGPLWRPDGTLWFSDVQGNVVRSVTPDGKVTVLIENAGGASNPPPDAFIGSNGMAQAPDGSVWMVQHGARQIVRIGPDRTLTPVVSRFEGKRFNSPNDLVFAKDGALTGGRVFADLTSKIDGLADGLKVDAKGNVYTTGPGGVWVLSPAGKHLGTIRPPEGPANCGWGDDGKTLYLTAVTSVYRVKTLVGR